MQWDRLLLRHYSPPGITISIQPLVYVLVTDNMVVLRAQLHDKHVLPLWKSTTYRWYICKDIDLDSLVNSRVAIIHLTFFCRLQKVYRVLCH